MFKKTNICPLFFIYILSGSPLLGQANLPVDTLREQSVIKIRVGKIDQGFSQLQQLLEQFHQ